MLLWLGGGGGGYRVTGVEGARDGAGGTVLLVWMGGSHVAELQGAVVSPLDDGDAADGISPGEVDTCTSAAIKRERVDRF